MKKILIFLFPIFLINWSLEKDTKEIQVYSKVSSTGYKAYKVELQIEKDIQTIGDFLLNVTGHSKWVHNCLQSTKPQSYSQNHFVIQYIIDTPWPVKDREVFFDTQYTDSQQNQVRVINIQMNVVSQFPVSSKDRVLITKGYIQIFLKEIDPGKTSVIFIYDLDPAENLAKTLANPFQYQIAYYTMKNLKEQFK